MRIFVELTIEMLKLITRLSLALADYSFPSTGLLILQVATALSWLGLLRLLGLPRDWDALKLLRNAALVRCLTHRRIGNLAAALSFCLRLSLYYVELMG